MNLHDVVKLEKRDSPTMAQIKKDIDVDSAEETLALHEAFTSRKNHALNFFLEKTQYSEGTLKATLQVVERVQALRAQALIQYGGLPPELKLGLESDSRGRGLGTAESDVLTTAAASPWATMASLRELADALRFVLMPVELLKTEVTLHADAPHQAIQEFKKLSPWFNVYAMAPHGYYSLQQHIQLEKEAEPIYSTQTAFAAVEMTVPMLRQMQGEINKLRQGYDRHERRLDQNDASLKALSVKIDAIQAQVQKQQEEQLRRELKALKEAELAAQKAEQFRLLDPMLIAFPKSSSVHEDGLALVGPCWGPDFHEAVARALKLEVVAGQRKTLAKAWNTSWRNYR